MREREDDAGVREWDDAVVRAEVRRSPITKTIAAREQDDDAMVRERDDAVRPERDDDAVVRAEEQRSPITKTIAARGRDDDAGVGERDDAVRPERDDAVVRAEERRSPITKTIAARERNDAVVRERNDAVRPEQDDAVVRAEGRRSPITKTIAARQRPKDDAVTTEDELAATLARAPLGGHAEVAGAPRSPGLDDEAALLRIGAVVGRYVVVRELGAGGMGVVCAAYDPELDRKVALKLLRPELADRRSRSRDEARARLVREAHALARLAHPHVVSIYDVGEHRGRVWLAMEHVEGVTLDAWLGAAPRTTPELLEVLIAAGRGLEAAHAAGLLHRDFKPDSVNRVEGPARALFRWFSSGLDPTRSRGASAQFGAIAPALTPARVNQTKP